MSAKPSKLVVGAPMMRIAGSAHRPIYGKIKPIAKVYKNGNIVLEGEIERWRPFGDDRASLASGSRFNHSEIRLVTDALMEAAREARLMSQITVKLQDLVGTINAAIRKGDSDEMKRLAAMIELSPTSPDACTHADGGDA